MTRVYCYYYYFINKCVDDCCEMREFTHNVYINITHLLNF